MFQPSFIGSVQSGHNGIFQLYWCFKRNLAPASEVQLNLFQPPACVVNKAISELIR